MIHRDVKPSNVLVDREGRVVLLDFGLVTEMNNEGVARTVTGNIVGTPAYMSPEQAMGTKLTPASDWYAVGVMLYQAITGKVPFDGEAHGLLLRKQLADPPPPNELVRGMPRALSALVQEMIARAPEQRPSGPSFIERIRSSIGDATGSRMSALGSYGIPISSPGPSGPGMAAPMFVGRETHLWALDEALEEVQRGGTVVAMVHGPSGMGKSALVKHYLDVLRAERPEVIVLEGRCYERESVPYKALDSLVDSMCRYLQLLPDVEAAKLLPRDVAALARLSSGSAASAFASVRRTPSPAIISSRWTPATASASVSRWSIRSAARTSRRATSSSRSERESRCGRMLAPVPLR